MAEPPKVTVACNKRTALLNPFLFLKSSAHKGLARQVLKHHKSTMEFAPTLFGLWGGSLIFSAWIINDFLRISACVVLCWFIITCILIRLNPFGLRDRPFLKILFWFFVLGGSLTVCTIAVLGSWQYSSVHSMVSQSSPDGTKRATLMCSDRIDVSYDLIIEPNRSRPILARSVGGFHFAEPSFSENPDIIWSADSTLVTVWFGEKAAFAFDFRADSPLPYQRLQTLSKINPVSY